MFVALNVSLLIKNPRPSFCSWNNVSMIIIIIIPVEHFSPERREEKQVDQARCSMINMKNQWVASRSESKRWSSLSSNSGRLTRWLKGGGRLERFDDGKEGGGGLVTMAERVGMHYRSNVELKRFCRENKNAYVPLTSQWRAEELTWWNIMTFADGSTTLWRDFVAWKWRSTVSLPVREDALKSCLKS